MLAEYSEDGTAAVLADFHLGRLSEGGRLTTLTNLLACFEEVQQLIENPGERKVIMEVICEAVMSRNIDVRVRGLALLVKIASSCYQYLEDYIDGVLVSITTKAIGSENKRVHEQGLEFWKAISQVEDPRDSNGRLIKKPDTSSYFVKRSLGKLVPTLFAELIRGALSENIGVPNWVGNAQQIDNDAVFKKTEEHQTDNNDPNTGENTLLKTTENASGIIGDENLKKPQSTNWWAPPREVIIYFSELCESYPEAIDSHVLPLVQTEIQHTDWRHRHAALWSMLVFLKQLDPHHAESVLQPFFPLIRKALRDKASSRVRSTALWVTSWMFEKYPALVVSMISQDLQQLIADLIVCLNDSEGRVSPSSCITLKSVVKAAYTIASREVEDNQRPTTFVLSPYYELISVQLVKAANRRLTAAFDGIRQVLLQSPEDCYWVVLDSTEELLILLQKMIELPEAHHVGCRCHESVQKILIGVLRSIMGILRLGESSTDQLGQKFKGCIQNLLTKFPSGLAREEALLAASTVASLLNR